MRTISKWIVAIFIVGGTTQALRAGEPIPFAETYALAEDRRAVLEQLVPGTEEYYYYHCLYYQQTEQFEKVEPLLKTWLERLGETPRLREIQHRQALLTYDRNPAETLDYLKRVLNLRFDHQAERRDAPPDLPTQLPPELLNRDRLTQQALRNQRNLQGFEDAALPRLIERPLTAEQRRELLARLTLPDHPRLVELILADLRDGVGFGAYPIHGQLLQSQLEELARQRPELLGNQQFVTAYLSKLRPPADTVWLVDRQERSAHVDRLLAFVRTLPPSQNSLKAHVLYHRLWLDRASGRYDRQRFLEYLALPRQAPYVSPTYLRQFPDGSTWVDLQADWQSITGLPPIRDEEPLIRSYLAHFFVEDTTYDAFKNYLEEQYLRKVFAETKIVNGLGDISQWVTWLTPGEFQQLKNRVDIDFAYTNPEFFAADAPVHLDFYTKNVSTLLVKIFEINAFNYYRDNQTEINTDINLDGLTPNWQYSFTYEDPPLRRVARHLELPELAGPGTYVVDFIGNGKSSRALIQKGRLRYVSRPTEAGLLVYVLDEQNHVLPQASVWLAGKEYKPRDNGEIYIPFSTQPGRVPIILQHGSLATLETFDHQAEQYELRAGMYVDRESLLRGRKASLLIRPTLLLNGRPADLSVLENTRLTITAYDLDDVQSTQEISNITLSAERDFVHELQVPARLKSLRVTLTAQVHSLSQNKKLDLSTSENFACNGLDTTELIACPHLARATSGFHLLVLGRTGEPIADRPVHLVLKHREFRQPITVTLKTDSAGHIALGFLEDIVSLEAQVASGATRSWPLRDDRQTVPPVLHGVTGQVLEIPYPAKAAEDEPLVSQVALLEVRGDTFVNDLIQAVQRAPGKLLIGPLPAGDYRLYLKRENQVVQLRISEAQPWNGYILGRQRFLELSPPKPLAIRQTQWTQDSLVVELENVTPAARVHLFAVRFYPAFDEFARLASVRARPAEWSAFPPALASYLTGRNIGDEYRYILDRRYATKFPGNMLPRPELLLNPWPVRQTQTAIQQAASGEAFGRVDRGLAAPAAAEAAGQAADGRQAAETVLDNLDFLRDPAVVLLDLRPDEQGRVTIPRNVFAGQTMIRIVASDADTVLTRHVYSDLAPVKPLDLRLARGLDPTGHFIRLNRVSRLAAGDTFLIDDMASTRFEIYDSLSKVFSLYYTLAPDPAFAEFRFLLEWDTLSEEKKQSLYAKYASHELNFFLYHHDPDFFRRVVQPFLHNKKEKQFLDYWLLGDNRSSFVTLWHYERLNTLERILYMRQAEQAAGAARELTDILDVTPSDPLRWKYLFDTALGLTALQAEGELAEGRRFAEEKSALMLQRDAAGAMGGGVVGDALAGLKAGAPALPSAAAPPGQAGNRQAKQLEADARKADEALDRAANALRRSAVRERQQYQQLFQPLDATQEWAENHYYHVPRESQTAELVPVRRFWAEYAAQNEPRFLSPYFPEASGNRTEMLLALAVLDLPPRSPKHTYQSDGARLNITLGGPALIFHEEVRQVTPSPQVAPLLVGQHYFRHDDRYEIQGGRRVDKFVTGEFLIQTAYGCQVVVTNPTSTTHQADVLIQIPRGAMPLAGAAPTKNVRVQLDPFTTKTIEYLFYFPLPGEYPHYPAHVAVDDQLVAFAAPAQLRAVEKLSDTDRGSWDYVSQQGTRDELLAFLRDRNLHSVDLGRIAWRMREASLFHEVLDVLSKRHVFHPVLWSYSIYHNARDAVREYLMHQESFVQECGPYLESSLLVVDPVDRRTFEHLEYKPLVNPRAHQLGERRQILNDRLAEQYKRLMDILACRRSLNDQDRLTVVYYLLLQDRIEEAKKLFATIHPENLDERVQYDYCLAYLDLFDVNLRHARQLAETYASYPVESWRKKFAVLGQQLSEIETGQAGVVDPLDRDQTQAQLAAAEPTFDLELQGSQILLTYRNLKSVQVNFYEMDIELLFSSNPFVQQYSGRFSYVRPNVSEVVELPAEQTRFVLAIPEALRTRNVLVEVVAAGRARAVPYYSNSLVVQTSDAYGQLRVLEADTQKPLPRVYVKVYARLRDGQVQFYKDGYTDLRGRFDYATLSTNQLDHVERFALLVLSEDRGAVVRELAPPKR